MSNRDIKFGIPGVLSLYTWKDFKKSLKYPLPFTLVVFAVFVVFSEDTYQLICDVVNLAVSVIPTIIGFVLAGYALLVGFGNKEFLMFLSKTRAGRPTLYQGLNSVFAFSLLFQLMFLIFASFVYFLIKLNFDLIFISNQVSYITNLLTLFVLIFGFFYSLFSVKDMIANVFSFGQMHHYKIKKDIKKKKEEETKNQAN